MTTIEELSGPAEYREASFRFRMIWHEYLNIEKEAKDEVAFMVKILEDEGYSRTKAIQKIIEDHRDLKGFSRATIYRGLPNEMKNNYISGAKQLSNTENVSNETFEKSQEEDVNLVNITTSQNETPNVEETGETEPSSFIVDLPPPEPEPQDPTITRFVGKLPKSVLRLAEKIELPPTKLELIANYSNKSILKDHPQIQEKLVKAIAALSIDEAKHAISQEIRDLETGAAVKIERSYYFDSTKREKIPKKVEREKHPIEIYLEFLDKIDEIMYLGTGHKLEEGEFSYEPNHIEYSENYRIKILSDINTNQLYKFEQDIEVAKDLFNNWEHLIIDELVKRGEIAPDHSEDIER
jgi:hypothetical protein